MRRAGFLLHIIPHREVYIVFKQVKVIIRQERVL